MTVAATERMDNPGARPIVQPMTNDILITGGGLAGGTLALALAQAGHKVTLIDKAPQSAQTDPGFDGRSYALALASQRLLKNIGLWSDLGDHAQPINGIKVSDGRAGEGPLSPFHLAFNAAEIEEGPMGYMLEDRYLRRALPAACAAAGVAVIDRAEVVAQQVMGGSIQVTLDTGSTHEAALLIGCDGRQSGTAQRAGIGRTGWGYGQTAVVCAVQHEADHDGVAHQFFMPSGPLAILPLPGKRSSIVWSETESRAAELMALDDTAFLAALRPAFGSFLGQISLDGVRFSYPLGLTLADRFVGDRVALAGDAAHGVHPIAGQGLNAGLRDVAALVEVVTQAKRRGEDIGSATVLSEYERWRRFDTATLALATDGFNKLFSNDNPLLRGMRDLGLGIVNALPGLRRGFIREAAGLTGDLPPLMRQ